MSSGEARPGPIVVGVEHSERSRDALALGRTLAHAAGAGLLLVSVYPVGARSATVEPGAYARALQEEAEAALDWVAAPLCGARPEARAAPCTSIPRGLHQIAATESALAIVVGTSHRGPFGRIVPGSVGERLLRGAPCPIAVATGGRRPRPLAQFARIGVGYVATPEGDAALRAAAGLAAHTGAAVRVLSVVEPRDVSPALPFGSDIDALETTAREALASAIRRATGAAPGPLQIDGELADGYPDDELARLSREVDLLVCGSSGHRGVGSFRLGSVPAGILRKARCPLLVVARGARDDFAALAPAATAA